MLDEEANRKKLNADIDKELASQLATYEKQISALKAENSGKNQQQILELE